MKDEVVKAIPYLEDAIVATNWRESPRWVPMIQFLRTKLSDDLLRTCSRDIGDFLFKKTEDYVEHYDFDRIVSQYLNRVPVPPAHLLPATHPLTPSQPHMHLHQPLQVGEDAPPPKEIKAPAASSSIMFLTHQGPAFQRPHLRSVSNPLPIALD